MRKSTRLSSIGLRQVSEPVKSFRTRFSLTSFAKRVQRLTEEQRSAISRTGFGYLLSVPNQSLNKVFLTEVIEAWNCERRAFEVGSGEISMSLLDVALILGLPVVGNPVVLEEEPFSDWEELYGAARGKRKVTMASLEARLDSLGEIVSDDFVRTFLLYTIGTFLSSNDGKVDSRYLSFLGNLDNVSRFSWGAAVVEDLCQWLDKRKENNVQYVGGCLIFLQTWSYEHFDIARPYLQDHDLTFPRVCRWDNKSNQRQRGTSRFKDLHDDQVIWKLQPTAGELQIHIIKEALELLGDNKELQRAEKCASSASTSTYVPGVDSELQLSISSKVCGEEVNFEDLVVEDTPTRLSTCAKEYREQEINHVIQIVEDTPTNSSICDRVHREQEKNGEIVIVEDTPTNSSICDRVHREQEKNGEIVIVEDTPTNSSICDRVHREQEKNGEIVIVEDTPTNSSIPGEVGTEEEFHAEKLIMEDTPTNLSIAEEAGREPEFNAKKFIVEDTPPKLSIPGEVGTEDEFHAEKLIMEDTPTNLSIAEEAGREPEFNAEKFIVEDTPPKLSFHDDDLRKKNVMLEEENTELKMKIGQLMEENGLLRRQIISKTQFEVQNDGLKKELDFLREENRNLRLSISRFVDRMDRHVSDFETNTTE